MVNVWKIAPGGRAYLWDETHEQKCITINWMNETNFEKFKTEEALRQAMKENGDPPNGSKDIWNFVRRVQRGDTVIANKGKSEIVGIGVVESEYLPPNDPRNPRKTAGEHCHARLVDWRIPKPVDIDQDTFPYRIPPTVLLLDTEQCEHIKQAYLEKYPELKDELDKLLPEQTPPPPPVEGIMLPLLQQLRQVIMYGPPGTGKTRQARRIALALLEGKEVIGEDEPEDEVERRLVPFREAGRFGLVVFHPAYEYEQFVGGIEPKVDGKDMSFRAEAGTFLKLCRKAKANGNNQYSVLVIDEINRGNLPKLLGELVYALEYRDRPVTLPFTYQDSNELIVPKNLYVIATMNSSDRSIGHIDVAIRRRFGLVPLRPRSDVVRDKWSKIDGSYGEKLAGLMEELNGALKNSNHDSSAADELGVGHSYFLPAEDANGDEAKEQVRRKWEYQVQPLLREYAQLLNSDSLKNYFKKSLNDWLT